MRKKGIWIWSHGWIYGNGVEELKILKRFLELFDDGSIVILSSSLIIFYNKSIFLFLVVVGGIFFNAFGLNS